MSGAATLASDIAGQSIAGLTALTDLLNPFTDNDPVQLIENVKNKLRIEPTAGGEAALSQLGEAVKPLQPVIEAVSEFKDTAGQQGLDLTGSPAFATFVNLIPDILAEIAGAGLATKAARVPKFAAEIKGARRGMPRPSGTSGGFVFTVRRDKRY